MDNFKQVDVIELNNYELSKVEGGWLQAALAIAGAVIYLYNEGGDFIKGWNSVK